MIDNNTLIIIASVLGAALIGVGASLAATRGDSTVASKALECMARQPEQAGSFQVNMLIAIGLVESISDDKKKVTVSASLFGRETKVELDVTQVKTLDE